MTLSPDFISLLNLSKNEQRVFNLLRTTPAGVSVATITRSTKIPRMTVYLTLETLEKRQLISPIKKGKRTLWVIQSAHDISHRLTTAIQALGTETALQVGVNNSGFTILYGIKGIMKSWESLQSLKPYTRVLGIQPTHSLQYSLGKLKWESTLRKLQENIRDKPVIIDGVLPEGYYEYIAQHFAYDPKLQKKMLHSFLGRATDMTFISKKYFQDNASELFILPDVAYLTDWKSEVSIEIRNPIMRDFLIELYGLAKGYGKHVDQNAHIAKLIEKLEN